MKRSVLLPFFCALVLLGFTGCKADFEYSTWPCRFAYDNMTHSDPTLAAAMDYNSRGVFCKITESVHGGVKYLSFETNNSMASFDVPETAEEQQAKFILGLNNGIIVGYQTFIYEPDGGYVGYDVQCPNCVRDNNNTINPTYPVTMSDAGIATCSKCGRKYDLNNGGIIQNGKENDKGLEKYKAFCSGPYGHISVFRP